MFNKHLHICMPNLRLPDLWRNKVDE